MKQSIRTIVTVLVCAFVFGIAQAQDPANPSIVGVWAFNYARSLAGAAADARAQLDNVPRFRAQVEAAYNGRLIAFNENGQYQLQLANGTLLQGTWQWDSSSTVLITDPSGASFRQQVVQLNATTLVLQPLTGNSPTFFPEYHYLRN